MPAKHLLSLINLKVQPMSNLNQLIHSIHSIANDGAEVRCSLYDLGHGVLERYSGSITVTSADGEVIQSDAYVGRYKDQLVELMCELTVQLILILDEMPVSVVGPKRLTLPGVHQLAA